MLHPIKHFRTITKHRHMVISNCFRAGIPFRGLLHDLSKYSPTEFIPGAKYWTGLKSPNEGERREYGYSLAWMHHKGRNKHHFEFWIDYSPAANGMVGIDMPDIYIAEMFCDRVAASKVYGNGSYTDASPQQYYEREKGHYVIHPATAEKLERLLKLLADEGEDAVFGYIRSRLKEKKPL